MADDIDHHAPISAEIVDDGGAADNNEVAFAGQWRLAWWKFRRHKLALVAGMIVICIYLVSIFANFLAPADPEAYAARYTYAPPQALHLFRDDRVAPYVTGFKVKIDTESLRRTFVTDDGVKLPVGFLVRGSAYRLWGLIPLDLHLIGPLNKGDPMYLWGADRLGRDMLSRVIFGTRVSMSIGLVGVGLSLMLGIVLGGVSGYFGGWVDLVVQRVIEFLLAIPTIPLWMGLAAAIPATVPPPACLLPHHGHPVGGRVDRVGAGHPRDASWRSRTRILSSPPGSTEPAKWRSSCGIWRRPSQAHIIASVTLAIPVMILSETALSFLGIGLRPPVVSWGVLLQEAQNMRSVATAPWLLLPCHGGDRRRAIAEFPRRWPSRRRRPVRELRGNTIMAGPPGDILLSVQNLSVDFPMRASTLHAVRDVSLDLRRGETPLPCRRERFGKVRDGPLHHAHRRQGGKTGRRPNPARSRHRENAGSRGAAADPITASAPFAAPASASSFRSR